MATKTISITLEAYERLRREKMEGESFSDVILRLTEKQKMDLTEFAGVWKDADEIEKIILKGRKEFNKNAEILP
jgi:predicted CopG family antitoxin